MTGMHRRQFLRLAGGGMVTVTALGSGLTLTGCDPLPLDTSAPDANGLVVHSSFTSRKIATTGQLVAGTSYVWHTDPDGGACFPAAGGGWVYVSNSEDAPGGVGYVQFASDGTIVGAGPCMPGVLTLANCAGGATPWGTWLTCEEFDQFGFGWVWEVHPTGAVPAVKRAAMGRFVHEAAAVDPVQQCVYLTEDRGQGALYRFLPTTWGDLSTGTLQVMTETAGVLGWATVPDPSAATVATRDQVPDTKRFNGGEGAAISKGRLIFTTKGDGRVWSYDPVANTLTVIYDDGVTPNGVLTGLDNVATSSAGVIYVAEDGGDMQIVLVREDGSTFPVVQVTGVTGSEITGPAFDPSGKRLYFSSQRNPGVTYEVKGPWNAFTTPGAVPL